MTDQVIFDRGYRTYEGPRLGPRGARKAVFKDGVRRVLGLGRKAREKIFPWSLISIAVVLAAVLIGAAWFARDAPAEVPSYGELFDFYSWIALLFIAFAGPQLLIPDRTRGVLSVYFSRPLTVDGYLAFKSLAFATVVGAIYMVPQLLLHLGLALISDDGFLSYLTDNIDILWKVPVTTLCFIALHGALVITLSSVIDRTGIAAAAFLGILVAGGAVAGRVAEATFPGARYASLLALDHHPRIIRDYLFQDTVDYPAEVAGFEVWASVVVIVVLVIAAAWFVRSRYRRLA